MTTNLTEPEATFSIADLGAKFGAQAAQTFSEVIRLERLMAARQVQIQELSQNEAKLAEYIEDLEAELRELRSKNIELEDQNRHLEVKVAGMATDSAAIPGGERDCKGG